MIVNTPPIPTSAAYRPAVRLKCCARLAQEYDLLVCADEIYTRYLFDGEFIPMRTLPGMADTYRHAQRLLEELPDDRLARGVYHRAPGADFRVFQHVNDGLTSVVAVRFAQRAALKRTRTAQRNRQTNTSRSYRKSCILCGRLP